MVTIDLNCDMGEGFGLYRAGQDDAIIPLVSSANIACGFHAGDPSTMRRTVQRCLEHRVAIGAHPGLPDLVGFGRREMDITPEEAYDMTLYQIGALAAFVQAEGGRLHHVKPHGALYNMAARRSELARAVAEAVYHFDPQLIFYGLSGSSLIEEAEQLGLTTASEVFADRAYEADGSLTPRGVEGSVLHDINQASQQALQMVTEQAVNVRQSASMVQLRAETLCVHGDSPQALPLLQQLHQVFKAHEIQIRTL